MQTSSALVVCLDNYAVVGFLGHPHATLLAGTLPEIFLGRRNTRNMLILAEAEASCPFAIHAIPLVLSADSDRPSQKAATDREKAVQPKPGGIADRFEPDVPQALPSK